MVRGIRLVANPHQESRRYSMPGGKNVKGLSFWVCFASREEALHTNNESCTLSAGL